MQKFMLIAKPRHLIANFFYLLSLPALLISLSAHADDQDTLNVIAGVSRQHDDNLFRTSSSERSENITTAYAGIRLDKLYSLQRFMLDYTLTAYKYQRNNYLDFNANEYKATWLWALTPYLTGTLSADRRQGQYGFLDFKTNNSLNISTKSSRNFEADLSPHGNWHLLAGFTHSSTVNTQSFQPDRGSTQDGVDVGLKYVFSSGSVIALRGHDRKGTYNNTILDPVNFYDSGFDEREAEATLDWRLSGQSDLNLRAAYVTREHNHFSQRDYSGLVGRVNYNWIPTGKLSLSFTASRDLASYQSQTIDYTQNDTFGIAPIYSISSKVTMKANASITERTFLGGGGIAASSRVDTSKLASIGLDWAPYRSISLGGNIQRSSRSSTLPGLDFTDTTVGLSANLYF